jgi:maltooligosyltrehalose trehalohydrolase
VSFESSLGATYMGDDSTHFLVWAPLAEKVEVRIMSPTERIVALKPDERGYHQATADGVKPGCLYVYRLDGKVERPDPASRSQPQGVHGPSEVLDTDFSWEDASWRGFDLEEYIIYELHVGTFSPEGTFDSIIPHLDALMELGITALELMPVCQFPGSRNWGYDGVYPFTVQDSYGGTEGLKRLVNACHRQGLAVILDVVYNHLGPEGNYLCDFGPYFTERYHTPWGAAVNFDGPESDEVRRLFIESALYWITELHIDALRIDAVHGIFDFSAQSFLEELGLAIHQKAALLKRQVHLIPESDLNDTSLIRPREDGGFGLDAQWNDDFHHALHTLLTEERSGYYQDFGELHHMAKAFREGFVYSGEYSVYRRRRHGNSSRDIPARQLVVFAQNHDQVGNRSSGDRLSCLVSLEGLKLAAGVVLLSPYIPLLFMGEEYGETSPFQYFTSHSDPALVEAVRRGRREELATFNWEGEPPDPQDEATFQKSKLNHDLRRGGHHRVLVEFYKELIRLRKEVPALRLLSKEHMELPDSDGKKVLMLRRWSETGEAVAVFHFGKEMISTSLPIPSGGWRKKLDSADTRWLGPGSQISDSLTSEGEASITLTPQSFVLLLSGG